jgi:hypothetical protein
LTVARSRKKSTPPILRVAISLCSCDRIEFFWKIPFALTVLRFLATRRFWTHVTWSVNHSVDNNTVQNWILGRTWNFGPYNFIYVPWRLDFFFQYDQNINELKLFISYLKSYFSNILNEKKQLLMYQENIILNLKLWETINKTHIQDFQKNIQNYDELIQKNRQLSNQYYKQNNQSLYYQYTLVKMINFFIIILVIQLIIYYFGSYYYSSTSR